MGIRASGTYVADLEPPLVSAEPQQASKAQFLIDMLVKMGIGQDIAPVVAEQAIEEKPDEDLFGLVAQVRSLQEKTTPKQALNKAAAKPTKPVYLKNDLRLVRQNSGDETYSNFQEMGVVIRLDRFL